MKIFYQILIILFTVGCLFIVRNEVISVLGNVSSYFNKDSNNILSTKLKGEEETPMPGKVITPGALRVVNDILNPNSKIELSKSNIIVITNEYRSEDSLLSPLKENTRLTLSAEKKLRDMFEGQYFEHKSPGGIDVGYLGDEVGYKYILIGENLAMGNFKDDRTLVSAWMASPGHRVNILNKNYTEIGVAVGKGIFEGKTVWMAVQHFGTPRSVCPVVDEVLYGTIIVDQKQIDDMEADLDIRLDNIRKGVVYEGSTKREQINNYNSLINNYNSLVNEVKIKIEKYNNQIREFNLCLLSKE